MARICVLATFGRCIFKYRREGWPHCWPEFGKAAGHILLISEGLYVFRKSGARYHEKIADTVWQLGWIPYWRGYLDFREEHTLWVLLDDQLYDGHDPIRFFKKLIDMKCVCPPTYTLGKTSSTWRFKWFPKSRILWILQYMDQTLWQNELQQTRLWIWTSYYII